MFNIFGNPDHRSTDPILVRIENDQEHEQESIQTNPDQDRYRELSKKLHKHNTLDDTEWDELEKLKDVLGISDN